MIRLLHLSCRTATVRSLAASAVVGILAALIPAGMPAGATPAPAVEVWEPDYQLYSSGKFVYQRHCALCHGPRGDGNGELAATTSPKPRSFAQGLFKFRTTPWEKLPTDDDLRRTITHGITGTGMGGFSQLREQELAGVIEFIKFFSRRWKRDENFAAPLEFPEPPGWLANPTLAAQRDLHAEKGKVLFTNLCATCHGASGDGKGPAANGLTDAWDQPVPPSNLRAEHLRCGDGPADIYRILVTGMNGTPMLAYGDSLTPEQRWQVVAYVLSLRREAGVTAAP
ncbi:MAG: cytochrome c [Verrucomicrobiales bacterium]|nr:cytochrome c [Verrucomicrobiales bacterium]